MVVVRAIFFMPGDNASPAIPLQVNPAVQIEQDSLLLQALALDDM
tara:strand:+ start:4520 stop:4654 length:135 start_codon:yes stop_codon:yes gene_type:complete